MSDMPSQTPPPGDKKPKLEPLDKPQKPKSIPSPEEFKDSGQFEYLGFVFSSEKDYETFKYKFLAQMANTMMQQIKNDSDKMVAAIKKMRDQNQ